MIHLSAEDCHTFGLHVANQDLSNPMTWQLPRIENAIRSALSHANPVKAVDDFRYAPNTDGSGADIQASLLETIVRNLRQEPMTESVQEKVDSYCNNADCKNELRTLLSICCALVSTQINLDPRTKAVTYVMQHLPNTDISRIIDVDIQLSHLQALSAALQRDLVLGSAYSNPFNDSLKKALWSVVKAYRAETVRTVLEDFQSFVSQYISTARFKSGDPMSNLEYCPTIADNEKASDLITKIQEIGLEWRFSDALLRLLREAL
eukprot:TRINITY_DN12152_c0_g1_i1.p1 TRINITY_DN12152_c0_g1~~TRINITY_DN12152_c0_g1_i1.p1  ORF type:complete len:263 (+),score=41.13 TRINITY_DN12152_c0_g1_i1:221-1009(+)